jgi:transposase
MASSGRRAKRFLSAEQKYDLWVRMLTGQLTTVQAAAEAGVDRTTIATLKRVARDGAIAALEASKPGRRQHTAAESAESARLRGEVDRLQGAIVEQAIELAALRGKSAWG